MVSIIDIGSNTIRMGVYLLESGEIRPLLASKFSCGLAGYRMKNEQGEFLSEEGVRELLRILHQFRRAVNGMPDVRVRVIASACMRGLSNEKEILARVLEETGFAIDIMSGEEEAFYGYYAIAKGLREPIGLLCDCGGGSTEIACFSGEKILQSYTFPVGSLQSYRDTVQGVFPTKEELQAIREMTYDWVQVLSMDTHGISVIETLGGSMRTAIPLAETLLDREEGNQELTRDEIQKLLELYQEDSVFFLKSLLRVKPERVHTLLPGLAIQSAVMDALGCDRVRVYETGVREGYLLRKLEEEGLL